VLSIGSSRAQPCGAALSFDVSTFLIAMPTTIPPTLHPHGPSADLSDPWSDLSAAGDGLCVDDFLTTHLSRVIQAMRRAATQSYAQAFGLTVPQWRLLSVLAQAGSLPFAELVVQATTDKALVSRTLRLLEQRGLVDLQSEGSTPRKRLLCRITPDGEALHAQVMPAARRSQADLIGLMAPEERRTVYLALERVRQHCLALALPGADDGAV
jgi:DNA-binding MarR family transcriptional regulator